MSDKKIPPAPRWDLDPIFPGGSKSKELKAHREKVKSDLKQAARIFDELPETIDSSTLTDWTDFILKFQAIVADIVLIQAFSGCLTAQNVEDAEAHAIEGESDEYFSQWEKLNAGLEAQSLKLSDDQWTMLVEAPALEGLSFPLNELRMIAKSKMPLEKEALALELSVNGYHAWNRLYDKMAGDLKAEFEEDGEKKMLSMGQLATKMSSPDRSIRERAFKAMYSAWETRADLAAMALNAQAGFRLSLYSNRNWSSPLYEPLVMSRMKEPTLDAMWSVISDQTHKLQPYIEAKKKLLNIDKFRWYDEVAPCGKSDTLYDFDKAGEFIVENFRSLSSDMADFARMALDKHWVEAEDRSGKAGGGFCTGFGPINESRVFMTYAGSFENLMTLAHELGHAYHQWVIRKQPFLAQSYPMPLAETASIFAETLVIDAALKQVTDPQEKLMLLDQKLQSAYTMFTNIHCRYLFDKAFYAERANGIVQTERLSEIMVESQKKAFGNLLDESGYHQLFWCSKLHFYITGAPFYNFPYTFGYLFSGGVYDRAKKEGPAFADKYRSLLTDTGCMMTEDLAQKHLGVNLSERGFWEDAVSRSLSDVDEFVKLAKG
ncbi:MAG: M3 family oligoendopeptidase [candidate division Zixibacteria bacterium]|nr:M3 family oligoendopeptidase [candidate division Zixibacteria bacterium]